jgi:hypothetical protein
LEGECIACVEWVANIIIYSIIILVLCIFGWFGGTIQKIGGGDNGRSKKRTSRA